MGLLDRLRAQAPAPSYEDSFETLTILKEVTTLKGTYVLMGTDQGRVFPVKLNHADHLRLTYRPLQISVPIFKEVDARVIANLDDIPVTTMDEDRAEVIDWNFIICGLRHQVSAAFSKMGHRWTVIDVKK